MEDYANCSRADFETTWRHHIIATGNRNRNDGNTSLDCHNERTFFEGTHSARPATCSFRKSNEGMPIFHLSDSLFHALQGTGTIFSIDEHKAPQLHDSSQERDLAKLFLKHESDVPGDGRKDCRRIT